MKILSSDQIRACDAYTIQNEPIASIDLMERASLIFFEAFLSKVGMSPRTVSVFCGTGNNGGDGLVIARLLHEMGWSVRTYLIQFSSSCSEDNSTNQKRLIDSGASLSILKDGSVIPEINSEVVIDALIGSGLTRPLTGLLETIAAKINESGAQVFSVDMPSGLYDQEDCAHHVDQMVRADYTYTFQSPKRNLLLPEYGKVAGKWSVLDIGLDERFINNLDSNEHLLDAETIKTLLLPRSEHSHKGTYGHAGLICGSKGMMGAAVLATSACLRSGVGLTTVHAPTIGNTVLQSTCPEAMFSGLGMEYVDIAPQTEKYSSLGVGPGIGQNPASREALLQIIESTICPLVIDADGLNLLQEEDLHKLPKGSILTPHPKEFVRLFGPTENSHLRLELLKHKAVKLQLTILIKGRHTCIATPDGALYFNSTGNPGMAKGGSGDVLTGLITGLISRGYESSDAVKVGCYIHGLAGDLAAETLGMEGMTAKDLCSHIPQAFLELESL